MWDKRGVNLKKFYHYISLVIFLIITTSCSDTRIKETIVEYHNELISEKYDVPITEIPLRLISFNDITAFQDNKFSGVVIITRNDCNHCLTAWDIYVDVLNTNTIKYEEILVLETDNLSPEDKHKMTEKYLVSVVPSLMKFSDGKLILLEVGILSTEDFITFIMN